MSCCSYQSSISADRKKNAYKRNCIDKALSRIDAELALIRLWIEHPEQFSQAVQPAFHSELHIIPKSQGLGIIALAEVAIALYLTKSVFQKNGKPAGMNQIANVFEKMFNCSFGSIYDQQEKILNRKPFNRTKALDFLRGLLINKEKDENNHLAIN